MKSVHLFVTLFLLSFYNLNAQITFEKVYGGVLTEEGKSVKQTYDGGYIIGGTNLVKTNDSGIVEWTKSYSSEYANITADSSYILVDNDNGDIYFTKVSGIGDTIWSTAYTDGLAREGYSIEQTTDGGYIAAGHYQDVSDSGMMLLKLDDLGGVSWRKTWSEITSAGFAYGYSAHETADNGYIIAGYTNINYYDTNQHTDVFVARTDSLGNQQWVKNIGGTSGESGYDVHETSDGHFLIAGSQFDATSSVAKMYLLKLNALGDTVWTRKYHGSSLSVLKSVWETTDGSYVVTGTSNITTPGSFTNVSVFKLDTSGNILWDRQYEGAGASAGYDFGNEIQQTKDGGYIVTGLSNSGGISNGDMYLIKLDSLGNRSFPLSASKNEEARNKIMLYPNPSKGIIYIESEMLGARLQIFSLDGKEVYTKEVQEGKDSLTLSGLAQGVYFFQVEKQGTTIYVEKFILTR